MQWIQFSMQRNLNPLLIIMAFVLCAYQHWPKRVLMLKCFEEAAIRQENENVLVYT